MKKLLFLALLFLPFIGKTQDRVFPLDAFTSFRIGNNLISFANGKLLVNGTEISGSANIINALTNSTSAAPSSSAVLAGIQASIVKANARMDSIKNVLTLFTKKAAADSATAAISRAGINPNDLIANPVMNQWVDSKISGAYFAPTVISFGTITANSIPVILQPVTNATSYTLLKNGSNIATLLPGNLTYTDANLKASTAYSYSATATDGSKVSMPVTASATTATTVVADNYTQTNFQDFTSFTQANAPNLLSGLNSYSFAYVNNPTTAFNNNLTVTENNAGNSYFNIQLKPGTVSGGVYKVTITGLRVAPSYFLLAGHETVTPDSFSNGTGIWQFTASGGGQLDNLALQLSTTPNATDTIASIKIEKVN